MGFTHTLLRLEAELAWHDEFLAALPQLLAPDQEGREPQPSQ